MKTILSAAALALIGSGAAFAQVPGLDPVAQLRAADANRDGRIARSEFVAWRSGQFRRLDRNGDGYLTRADSAGRRAPMGAGSEEALASLDANGDGRVSAAEFSRGPTPLFDRLDVDGNDVLTAAEIEAARSLRP